MRSMSCQCCVDGWHKVHDVVHMRRPVHKISRKIASKFFGTIKILPLFACKYADREMAARNLECRTVDAVLRRALSSGCLADLNDELKI